MSARPAILFSIILVILGPYYYFVDRPAVKHMEALKQESAKLLNLSTINSITLSRGTESLKYQQTSGAGPQRWKLVQPESAFMPQDLMTAMSDLLINAKQVEVVSDNLSDLGEFGLDNPKAELVIDSPDKPKPIKIYFGNENPTHTAIYAMVEGIPKVFLMGRNLEYYQTLMFQWVEGKQGKNA